MADGRKNNGGARPGAGRPKKSDEQELLEKLRPMDELFGTTLTAALKEGESYAMKMFAEYRWGKPAQTINSNVKVEEVSLPEWYDEE